MNLPKPLGYGTYVIAYAGTINDVDSAVTWSPFFLWDFGGSPGNGFNEVDIEHARWGNAGDPTSSQFVLRPLQSGAMPPQWKVRFKSTGMTSRGKGAGAQGSCTVVSPTDFQGRSIVYATSVVEWMPGSLKWATFDGLWDISSLPSLTSGSLVASFQYPPNAANWIPSFPSGTAPHANLWHISLR